MRRLVICKDVAKKDIIAQYMSDIVKAYQEGMTEEFEHMVDIHLGLSYHDEKDAVETTYEDLFGDTVYSIGVKHVNKCLEEGDDYYALESDGGENFYLVLSCWDDVSEELPDTIRFPNLEEGILYCQKADIKSVTIESASIESFKIYL